MQILYQDDPAVAKTYVLKYRAYFSDNEANDIYSDTFTVTIDDPCDPPMYTQPETSTPLEITVTELASAYTLSPLFSVTPSFCESDLVLTPDGILSGLYTFDEATQTFSFPQSTDLSLSGDTMTTYTIDLEYTVGNGVTETVLTKTLSITYKNPCIDTSYVTITAADLPSLEYIIADPPKDFAAHSAFTVTTTPLVGHSLCGDLSYSA